MKKLTMCLFFMILPSLLSRVAEADTLYVAGFARFWDDRISRVDGSRLEWATYQSNQKLQFLEVELWDQDGSCSDYIIGCSEADDDLYAITTTDSIGFYIFSNIPDNVDLYIRTRYQTTYGEVASEDDTLLVTSSWPTK